MSRSPRWLCRSCHAVLGEIQGGVLVLANGVPLRLSGTTLRIICPKCQAPRVAVVGVVVEGVA